GRICEEAFVSHLFENTEPPPLAHLCQPGRCFSHLQVCLEKSLDSPFGVATSPGDPPSTTRVDHLRMRALLRTHGIDDPLNQPNVLKNRLITRHRRGDATCEWYPEQNPEDEIGPTQAFQFSSEVVQRERPHGRHDRQSSLDILRRIPVGRCWH